MLAKRIIPCLDVTHGRVVKGVNFVELKDAGDPVDTWRQSGDHWFQRKRNQKAAKCAPAESSAQDFSDPDQRAGAKQRRQQVIERKAPRSRQRVDQVDRRKHNAL